MKLTAVQSNWRYQQQVFVVRLESAYSISSQNEAINTVGFKDFRFLVPDFLQAMLISKLFGLPALSKLDRAEILKLLVKPLLAHFKRTE